MATSAAAKASPWRHLGSTMASSRRSGYLKVASSANYSCQGLNLRNSQRLARQPLVVTSSGRFYSTSSTQDRIEYYQINKDNTVSCRIPVDIPQQMPRLTDFLWENTDLFADRVALVCPDSDKYYTHGQVRAAAKKFGARLVEMEVLRKKGDTLAVINPNSYEFAVSFLGAIAVGGVTSPCNPTYVGEELAHLFHLGEPKGVVTTSKELDNVLEAVTMLGKDNPVNTVIVSDAQQEADIKPQKAIPAGVKVIPWTTVLPENDNGASAGSDNDILLPGAKDTYSQHDLTVLPFSSGTTGLAKGVHLTHRSLASNLLQFSQPALTQMEHGEKIVGLLPFFHIYGMNVILNYGIRFGSMVALMEKFEPQALLDILLKHRPTMFNLVPPILTFLAKSPMVKREHLASLRTIACGAAPASPTLIKELVDKFQLTSNFQEGYGMTESSPVSHWLPYTSKNYGSCGGPLPGTVAAIKDVTTGENLGPNQRGEIVIKGPQVMVGYHKNPKATAETITPDGWLRTGDIGYYDEEGFFSVVDRVKELIKVKGLQVAPAELEDILHKHPQLADAAVIGIPDERLGEAPRAFVVPKNGPDGKPLPVDPNEVAEMVKSHVSEHKYLAGGVEIVASLPKSQTGKILRRQLKEDYMKKISEGS